MALTIREATLDDVEAILAIGEDLYDGLDYIPAMLRIFMQSNQFLFIVGEIDGQVVAHQGFRRSPDGKIFGLAGRSHPAYKGLGIRRRDVESPWIQFYVPRIGNVTGSVYVERMTPYVRDMRKGQFETVYLWNIFVYKYSGFQTLRNRLDNWSTPMECTQLVELSYTKALEFLTKTEKIETFLKNFASGYVPAHTYLRPMKINKVDLREIFTTSKVIVKLVDCDGKPVGTHVQTLTPDYELSSLSYSCVNPVRVGVQFHVFFYGADIQMLPGHVTLHLRSLERVWNGNVSLLVHVSDEIGTQAVEECLRPGLGERFLGKYYDGTPFLLGRSPPEIPSQL